MHTDFTLEKESVRIDLLGPRTRLFDGTPHGLNYKQKLKCLYRARVNLARAIYSDAEIYLLDDPLAAVDSKVATKLYDNCINGYLKDKTRILVTHQVKYLENASNIVFMDKG